MMMAAPQHQPQPQPQVDRRLLGELEAMGFSSSLATTALHSTGNAGIEAAVTWIVDHDQEDPHTNQNPSPRRESFSVDIQLPEPSFLTEAMKIKAQELREQAARRKKSEERNMQKQREKERIQARKELLQARKILEENESKRQIAARQAEKEEERRARERILQKLENDKLERRRFMGLSLERSDGYHKVSTFTPLNKEDNTTAAKVSLVDMADRMRECLRSLRRNHQDEDGRVRRAFETLATCIRNVVKKHEDKYRRIRLANPVLLDRIGRFKEAVEFLELCGFEKTEDEGDRFLFLSREKIDMAVLNLAVSLLKTALTNPFFGLF